MQVAFSFVLCFACTVTIMWLAGYFMTRGGLSLDLGIYRMNLLSLIDPDDSWSRLLRDREQTIGDYEGFNYLGIGILVLGLVAAVELVRSPGVRVNVRAVVPLALVCIGLSILALSPRVVLGRHELISYPLPAYLADGIRAFRASGRMFWPVFYAIYLAVLCFIFHRFNRRVAASLCVVLIGLQVADSSAALQHFRNRFRNPPAWSSPLQSPFWGELAQRYKNVIYVLPRNAPPSYLPLAHFASQHRMTINVGYFARVDPVKEHQMREKIVQQVLANRFDPAAFYVFEDDALWQTALRQLDATHSARVVDGFRVIAPNFANVDDHRDPGLKNAWP
jgi:hypothetical protein